MNKIKTTCPVCGVARMAVNGRLICCVPKADVPPPLPPQDDCRFRGSELRLQECPTCCGKVRVKVFACESHGECTLAKAIEGVSCCQGCQQYRSANT